MKNKVTTGFSKFSKSQKIAWLAEQTGFDTGAADFLSAFEIKDDSLQDIIAGLSENHISNFHLPFCVAPNFLVNGSMKVFPLVTEESSVVAALAKAAGFWAKRGGFKAELTGNEKKGQLHFLWNGSYSLLNLNFREIKMKLLAEASPLMENMEKRGGGVLDMVLVHKPRILFNYYQIDVTFNTCDAMGANFINSCLEQFGKSLQNYLRSKDDWHEEDRKCEIIMAVLSNYTPGSLAKAWVECPVTNLVENSDDETSQKFAEKFIIAAHIAQEDVSRAATHNKGIFNGIDALALATGNDFRAIEANGHAFAARHGRYAGLSRAMINDGVFVLSLELPLAVGVVGGVTSIHPMAKFAMKILEDPSAAELMQYMAVAGLASNWSAIQALITEGIQKGHMKMHLSNILNSLGASDEQKRAARLYFQNRDVNFAEVEKYLKQL